MSKFVATRHESEAAVKSLLSGNRLRRREAALLDHVSK